MSTLATIRSGERFGSEQFAGAAQVQQLQQLQWYAVQTRSRHEKRVTADLREKAVDAYLPLCSSEHQWSDRRKMVEEPLFPGYVFVKIAASAQARVSVLQTIGVVSFLGARGAGVPIPEEEIAAIHSVLQQGVTVEAHPFVQVGQRVRVCGGSLDGLEGILTGIDGKKNLVLSIRLIERSVAMRITGYTVVPV